MLKPYHLLLGIGVAALSLTAGVEGLRRSVLALEGQRLAAAPSPPLMIPGASAILVLGSWLCVALLRYRQASLKLITAWSGVATVLAVLFHLNHVAYAVNCERLVRATARAPLAHRCVELQRRGRLQVEPAL